MIAVTFALPNESADFVKRLRARDCPYRDEVRVLYTGVGQTVARPRLENLLRKEKPRFLISSGFAGATNDGLKVGDLLLAENFSDPALMQGLEAVTRGRLVTSMRVIDSTVEREQMAREQNAVAIDMETESIAEICAKHSVPMISLRAISDTPKEQFGIQMRFLFDLERQRTPVGRLLFHLVRHPNSLGQLRKLIRQVAIARRALAEGLDRILRRKSIFE